MTCICLMLRDRMRKILSVTWLAKTSLEADRRKKANSSRVR